jgi:hypothetical protein
MKKIIIMAAMLLGLNLGATQFYYNSFTTNNDSTALTLATNIASGAIQGSIAGSLSPAVIALAGGLTTNNYILYADTNGTALYWWEQATNYASTNQPASLVTQPQLTGTSNTLWQSSTNYLVQESAAVAGSTYSNNPAGYLPTSATNNITALGNAVVSSILSGGGFTVSNYPSASGVTVTITATGTNNVNVTNLNATSLATYGALTTNLSSWSAYVAPINDYTNANIYTNGLLSAAIAASTYQPVGVYLTGSSNLNYGNVTNPPAMPSTNGLVTAAVTNGFATTNFVVSQGYTNANILNTYATTNYVNAALSTLITSTGLNSESNSLQTQISSNTTAIAQTWPTNQPFVGVISISSNMTVSFSTNAGIITATLGSYGGAVTGFQPATTNGTNWSGIPTNTILLTTNVVTSIAAGANATVSSVTNASGISYTIGSGSAQNSTAWQSVSFTTTPSMLTTPTVFSWSSALVAAPSSLKAYYNGSAYSVSTLTANGTSGFSYADSGGAIGTNHTVVVIGFCE